MKNILKTFALIGLFGFASQASAVVIQGETNPVDNTADFTWSINSDGNLEVSINNTSNFDARITGFQFEITDDVTGITALIDVGGTLDDAGWSWTTDVTGCDAEECLITGRNLNGGDPLEGISVGSTATFTFVGDFVDPTNIDNIMVRFQRTGADGEGSDRGYACEVDCEPPEVPEPGTMALFGAGLLGLGAAWRRRERQGAKA